jgi:hypothetical protein
MRPFIATIWVISAIFAIWLQFQYKNANYPNTWRWRLSLFLSGFFLTSFGGLFLMAGADIKVLSISILLGGTFGGLIFSYASPNSMKGIYPKRTENKQSSSDEESDLNGLDTKN